MSPTLKRDRKVLTRAELETGQLVTPIPTMSELLQTLTGFGPFRIKALLNTIKYKQTNK